MARAAATVAWVALAVCLASCTDGSPRAAAAPDVDPPLAVVTHVVDGDTLDVEVGGRPERLRLIGIDTPEIAHNDLTAECFGPEATERLAALVPEGTVVRLERDDEPRDQYGRLLVYLHRDADALFVNLSLVQTGHARPLTIEPNTTHTVAIARAAATAAEQGLGLWGACPGSQ